MSFDISFATPLLGYHKSASLSKEEGGQMLMFAHHFFMTVERQAPLINANSRRDQHWRKSYLKASRACASRMTPSMH